MGRNRGNFVIYELNGREDFHMTAYRVGGSIELINHAIFFGVANDYPNFIII